MTIQTMELDLIKALKACHTQLEKDCCRAIGGKEIREAAIEEYKRRGKLSPLSLAIAEKYGFRPDEALEKYAEEAESGADHA